MTDPSFAVLLVLGIIGGRRQSRCCGIGKEAQDMGSRATSLLAILSIASLAGCGGAMNSVLSAPQAQAAATAGFAESAHRPLVNPPTTAVVAQRSTTEGLSAIPAPLEAIPAPLEAIPAPLEAIPAPLEAIPAIGPLTALGIPSACLKKGAANLAACNTKVRTDITVQPAATPAQLLFGLLPGWVQALYNLPAINMKDGKGKTIALVVAFDDPVAEADLAVYRATFGMPPCTTANGCFKKIAQDGSSNYPVTDIGWSVETATDIETASALCPACNLLLVEASSANIPDLATAVDTAVANGADVVSNSYGVAEAADNVRYDSHFNHPGVAIVVSAGDQGYGVTFPASSEYVIAVGGTTLYQSAGGISEVAWPLTNSGCSAYIPKPSWQKDRGCPNRTMNDLAVVADPATGMAIYDSILNGNSGGWTVIGGTSIGAPIVSAIIAMSKHPEHYFTAQKLFDHSNNFFNITAGSNGTCGNYYCTAGQGYDGPTGLGSPNGNSAFNS